MLGSHIYCVDDLEWPFHGSASRAISAVAELLVVLVFSSQLLLVQLV